MELRQVRYFVTIAETKSLTHAANQLFISQPALTENIKNLEEELGVKLFNRSRKGMELTNTGITFLEYAESLLTQASKAVEIVSDAEENPTGHVSVILPASISSILSLPLYKKVSKQFPNIKLSLEEVLMGNIQNTFDSGITDLIITYNLEKTDNMIIEPIMREDLYLVCPYVPQKKVPSNVKFKNLNNYPIIMPKIQRGLEHIILNKAQELNIELDILPNTVPLPIMLKLVEIGAGNAILPWYVFHDLRAENRINAMKIVTPSIHRTTNLVFPKNRPCSNATKKVMEVIRSIIIDLHGQNLLRGKLLIKK